MEQKIDVLKEKMLEGTAVAVDFENIISQQGLSMEIIGMLAAYYAIDDTVKKIVRDFSDALVLRNEHEAYKRSD